MRILVHSLYVLDITVTSTGNSQNSPHCSWAYRCEYTDDTKRKCAMALCNAMGYSTGEFIKSSNNFCSSGFTDSKSWNYVLNKNEIEYDRLPREASITAKCFGKQHGKSFIHNISR